MKNKYLILLFIIVVVSAAYFYVTYQYINGKVTKINRIEKDIKKDQEKLNSAKVLNDQLQEVSKVILNSITNVNSFSTDEVNDFVKTLADLADKYHIPVNSVVPKPLNGDLNLVEHGFTMQLNCDYIQLGKFLTELESYDYIMKIRTLDVKPAGGRTKSDADQNVAQVTRYDVTLELSIYKIKKEA